MQEIITKNIKDYLHLYYGCECRVYNQWDTDGWKDYVRPELLLDVEDEDSEVGGVRLILRKLSDMTYEEAVELYNTQYPDIDIHDSRKASYIHHLCSGVGIYVETNITITDSIEVTRKLLSKGFDLFGLIEAGLAIEKQK